LLLVLADQPLITSAYLNRLIDEFTLVNNCIVATSYSKHKKGVPAIFDPSYFNALSQLKDDFGARYILNQDSPNIKVCTINNSILDLDTLDDYNNFIENQSDTI
jgi:molybdenum cofactor cytidylyltransferase